MRTKRLVLIVIAAATLALPASSRAARVTGARLDEVDLYEDESLTRSKTVPAAKVGFPIQIDGSNARAVKIRYQGRSYWVIRAMVETEGLDSALRKEAVTNHSVGAGRGLGK